VNDRRIPGVGPEADVRDIVEDFRCFHGEGCPEVCDSPDPVKVTMAVFDYLRAEGLLREGV
jgi:hypothetical protein